MKKHVCVVWGYDISVSVIGNGIEQLYKQYVAYHEEEMNSGPSYRNYAVRFANWFLVRGLQVYVYPYEGRWKDKLTFRLFLGLGKKIGEVLQGVVLEKPKTEPETTLHV